MSCGSGSNCAIKTNLKCACELNLAASMSCHKTVDNMFHSETLSGFQKPFRSNARAHQNFEEQHRGNFMFMQILHERSRGIATSFNSLQISSVKTYMCPHS